MVAAWVGNMDRLGDSRRHMAVKYARSSTIGTRLRNRSQSRMRRSPRWSLCRMNRIVASTIQRLSSACTMRHWLLRSGPALASSSAPSPDGAPPPSSDLPPVGQAHLAGPGLQPQSSFPLPVLRTMKRGCRSSSGSNSAIRSPPRPITSIPRPPVASRIRSATRSRLSFSRTKPGTDSPRKSRPLCSHLLRPVSYMYCVASGGLGLAGVGFAPAPVPKEPHLVSHTYLRPAKQPSPHFLGEVLPRTPPEGMLRARGDFMARREVKCERGSFGGHLKKGCPEKGASAPASPSPPEPRIQSVTTFT